MIYSFEDFENGLLERGVSQKTLEEYQYKMCHWYDETDDMNLEELIDDFIEHFDLEMSN
jgi:hypothetical protein